MKSGLQEILESGVAPGLRIGNAVDPNSVYAKAPKAFKEIERGEGRSKRPIGAREISRYFGMSTDFIKRKWTETNPKAFACILIFLSSIFMASAGQLTAGETLQDGQLVHASDLMNLVQNATINPVFISGQPIDNSPLYSDWMIIYSPTLGGTFQKVQLNYIFNNLQGYTLLPSGTPVYTNLDLFSFYSAAGTNMESITFSNLMNFVFAASDTAAIKWQDYAYTNLPPTNAPNLSLPLNDDLLWVSHDTNVAGSHTNYTGYTMTLAGAITNLTSTTFPIFSPTNFNQFSTNTTTISSNSLVEVFAPIITNTYIFTNNIGGTNYAVTNTVYGTNSSIAKMTFGQLKGWLNFDAPQRFESGLFAIGNSPSMISVHGLSGTPQYVRWVLVETNTTDSGFTQGSEIDVNSFYAAVGQNSAFTGGANATNVFLYVSTSGNIAFYNGSIPVNITRTNWNSKCYATYYFR